MTEEKKLVPTPSPEKEEGRQKTALHKASHCSKQQVLGFKNKKTTNHIPQFWIGLVCAEVVYPA